MELPPMASLLQMIVNGEEYSIMPARCRRYVAELLNGMEMEPAL